MGEKPGVRPAVRPMPGSAGKEGGIEERAAVATANPENAGAR